MKLKIFSLLRSVLLVLTVFAACGTDDKESNDDYTLRVGTLKGPTGMGMAKMISDNNASKTKDITLYGAPEDLSAALINGSLDVAAVPVNLAAVINKRTNGEYLVAAINTLGVLYIVENGNTLTSLADLEGKTLYATGQGSTPEYMLNYILEKNNLTDGNILKAYALLGYGKAEEAESAISVARSLNPHDFRIFAFDSIRHLVV